MGLTASIGSLLQVVMAVACCGNRARRVSFGDRGAFPVFTCENADSRPTRRQCPPDRRVFGHWAAVIALQQCGAISGRRVDAPNTTPQFAEKPAGVPRHAD